MKKNGCAIAFVLIVGIFLAFGLFVAQQTAARPASNQVTLHASPGNSVVQMFDSLDGQSDTRTFADGTICQKLGGPSTVTEAGITMRFHKLSCMGTTGYVNAKWVR